MTNRFFPSKNAKRLAIWCVMIVFSFNLGYMVAFYKMQDLNCIHQMDPGHLDRRELREGYHGLKHQKTFLVIAIISAPKNFERRQACRDSWLHLTRQFREQIIPLFVIGTNELGSGIGDKISDENLKNKDILTLPMQDAYSSLTRKVLKMFVQIDQNIDFQYLIKTDDDSFIRVPEILDELKNSNYQEKLYWGYFDGRAPIFRKDTSKYVEKNYILCDKYIPYALGGGYVLSRDLVHFLAENENDFEIFRNEDVAVGTWLSSLKLNRVHDVRFDTEFKSRGCSNKDLVSHKQSVQEMKSKSYSILTNNQLCGREVTNFKPYNYNWEVPPSKCCQRI